MLQVGEIISSIASGAKTFAAKFFPGNNESVDLDQTASMLTRASEEHDNVLRSAARGGVKVALAMLWAWYPEINMKGICPRGNNKVVIILFQVYDKCLFLML